ncbi:DUF1152 domain-containing protein [Aquimarina sp. 2201CG5-10]|uniref:DUF1152 domain-containing protein n=1 Tax=Aquimarina callyspongiae TaxID=3098150 RepID=UPI002AB56AAF|nr:DUF1152 domain-containing protein [Aquimarina sp. 2201CG5-10]MDY8137758.1 DUF1152 domain-containing protein [Aquimarina sp. 2201CG5-10]
MYTLDRIPFFQEIEESNNILLAGMGGGFDIYAALPLYFNLIKQGKKVTIANYSFTNLNDTSSELVFPYCYKIRSGDNIYSQPKYFPEKYLKLWFQEQGILVDIYGFERIAVKPLQKAYEYLVHKHEIDTLILVDGGTDCLMFGDEEGLGTPQEDISSMAAVFQTKIDKKLLVSIGFGVDHYHGVSHYRFLENLAELDREEAYLGSFQILNSMSEGQKYKEAIDFVDDHMKGMESIVSNSIISALEGYYGNYHRTGRTKGSELWINPLMTMYWCFRLENVLNKNKYYEYIKHTNTIGEFNAKLSEYRRNVKDFREKKQIPI